MYSMTEVFYIKKLIHFVFQIKIESIIYSQTLYIRSRIDCLGLVFIGFSSQKLEDALVCTEGQQADVLRERQRGKAEGNHRHPSCQVRFS